MTVPQNETDDGASVGTINGTAIGSASALNVISQITVPAGAAGINYDFYLGIPSV
jgi:hypothetical protein